MCKAALVCEPFKDVDLTSLEVYGEVEFIYPLKRPPMLKYEAFITDVRKWANLRFDIDSDYFVFAGPTVCVALAFHAIALEFGENPKVLIWDPHRLEYTDGIRSTGK